MNNSHYNTHFVAVVGGSVAGSEAAYILAEKGFRVVVFDQKKLSYGKIEDGLPLWHVGLRNKEEANIDSRLSHENIRFVPKFKLGRDADIDDLINDWGFSAVIIAIGAWRDRKIPIPEIDTFHHQGIVYQNELLLWFNHKHEPNFKGPKFFIPDGTGVVGGGLASLDVMKIVMMEIVQRELKAQKNIDVDVFTLEKMGIKDFLNENKTSLDDLGIKGATLFYRRKAEDMPLKPTKSDGEEDISRAKKVSKKLLESYQDKFLFHFKPLSVPLRIISEKGEFKGMVFQNVKTHKNGKLEEIPGSTNEFRSSLIISSIGSLPEETPCLPHKGSILETYGELGCRVKGYDNVFAIGNVVTGRGNILESKKHGRIVTGKIIEDHFDPNRDTEKLLEDKYHNWFRSVEGEVDQKLGNILHVLEERSTPQDEKVNDILERSEALQRRAGFDGDYSKWAEQNKPIRLEQLLQKKN
jgi:NADPH-dependent glutamate synthase beta subunit-like oxidoreductase